MTTCCYPATSGINSERTRAIGSWPLAKTRPWVGNLRKPEKIKANRWASECSYASECVHIRQKKFVHNFRYSARTRVIVDEKSVRIVQLMKNPAARFFLVANKEKRIPTAANPRGADYRRLADRFHPRGLMPRG